LYCNAMAKTFRPYTLDQQLLLPPDLRTWVPEGHLALYVSDVVDALDLSTILRVYATADPRGGVPYHPAMLVKLLLYAYCTGMPSSRRIERATYEDVPMRVLAGDQHPDHDTIAAFRKQHLTALSALFVQVLQLCERAGLVKLGHVALDGTKVQANASKHKAMSYERMTETEQHLAAEVAALLAQAAARDASEDQQYGPGRRGDELPAELARRESRLVKIREAKASLEADARERAAAAAVEVRAQLVARARQTEETGKRPSGRPPAVPDPETAVPEARAQRNFTDPESRIMRDGATKGFVQAYNAQAVVDSHTQVIVATGVTQAANDVQQLVPMLEQVQANTGRWPTVASADAGYYSEANVTAAALAAVDLYIPPDKQSHGRSAAPSNDHDSLPPPPPSSSSPSPSPPAAHTAGSVAIAETRDARPPSVREQMRAKLRTMEGQALYKMRKAIVEPVFGQTKERRGFRRFALRGLRNVAAEWDLICLTHNVLKLFRAGGRLQPA
jgi:transposase